MASEAEHNSIPIVSDEPKVEEAKAGETKTEETTDAPAAEGNKYEFGIAMSCGGCSGAVNRVLKNLEGENSLPLSRRSSRASIIPCHLL